MRLVLIPITLVLLSSCASAGGPGPMPDEDCRIDRFGGCAEPRRRAADGDSAAMLQIGKAYWNNGQINRAIGWYRRSALAGSGEGMALYGANISDTDDALGWMERGAATDDPHARRILAASLAYRARPADETRIVALSGRLLAEGEFEAALPYAKWLRNHRPARAREVYAAMVARGDYSAHRPLAALLRTTEGGAADPARARELYQSYLTRAGVDLESMEALAQMAERGEGGPVDPEGAARLRAAIQAERDAHPPSIDEII